MTINGFFTCVSASRSSWRHVMRERARRGTRSLGQLSERAGSTRSYLRWSKVSSGQNWPRAQPPAKCMRVCVWFLSLVRRGNKHLLHRCAERSHQSLICEEALLVLYSSSLVHSNRRSIKRCGCSSWHLNFYNFILLKVLN